MLDSSTCLFINHFVFAFFKKRKKKGKKGKIEKRKKKETYSMGTTNIALKHALLDTIL